MTDALAKLLESSQPAQRLATGFGFTEGPLWHPDGFYYFVDIRANKLHLAPAIPDWIGTLRLERIPIMGGHLGVEVTGDVVKVLERLRLSNFTGISLGNRARTQVAAAPATAPAAPPAGRR